MEVIFNDATLIVDELESKDLPIMHRELEGITPPIWTFPTKDILGGVKNLLSSKYVDLNLYLFRIRIDTGGGDEVTLNIYGYARSQSGKK